MSLCIVLPNRNAQLSLQENEQAFYWSACIESVLRRHGITGVSTVDADSDNVNKAPALRIYARGREIESKTSPMLLEGPRSPQELAALGITAEPQEAETILLANSKGKNIGQLAYQACLVRRIPKNGEHSAPYPNKSSDPRWNNRTIRYQVFKDYPGWEPIFLMITEGKTAVIGLKKQGIIVLGIPLGDLLAAGYAFPPLDAGYYQMMASPPNLEIELAFCELVEQLAQQGDVDIHRVPLWPDGKKFALTIRHDCDRPIKLISLLGLLLFYRKHGIKASFGILQNQISRIQLWLIKLFGHEINLHSIAASTADLVKEKDALSLLAGCPIRGFHSHGGAGSEGFLGDRHYGWAQEASFEYVEMLGRSTRQPHAINRIVDGLPTATHLIAPGVHLSLDGGMAPEQHYLQQILAVLPRVKDKGEHLVIMNHPDIHVDQLKQLILKVLQESPWTATLGEVVQWFRFSRLISQGQ